MFCRHVFGNISGGFRGISLFFGNFVGPRPREISETLTRVILVFIPGDKELNIILLLCVFT